MHFEMHFKVYCNTYVYMYVASTVELAHFDFRVFTFHELNILQNNEYLPISVFNIIHFCVLPDKFCFSLVKIVCCEDDTTLYLYSVVCGVYCDSMDV